MPAQPASPFDPPPPAPNGRPAPAATTLFSDPGADSASQTANAHGQETLHPVDIVGPFVFAPVIAGLFWGQTSPARIMLVVTVHMIITAVFFVALLLIGPRMSRHSYVQIEDMWPLFTGALVGSVPWILWVDDDTGYALLALTVTGVLASDTLFLAVRPGRVWPFLASFEGVSFAAYLLYRRAWGPALFVILFMLHLVGGYQSVQVLLTKLRSEQDASDILAHTDHLTRLQNRRGLARHLGLVSQSAVPMVSLAVIDIDNFKQLNDRYGQAGGDAILQAVAEELSATLGRHWFLSRTGGDEFIAISVRDRASSLAPKLSSFNLANERGPGLSSVTLSAGIAYGQPTDELVSDASAALQIAKTMGKNRSVEVDNVLRSRIRAERKLASRLEGAIASGEITMWAQPIVELSGGRPVSYELLARWPQTDGRVIAPSDFIHLAEDQGLTEALGEAVVRKALQTLGQLPDGISVSVNVSPVHFASPSFNPFLEQALADAPVPVAAEALIIEVVESDFDTDDSAWLSAAHNVRSLGVRVAIDDFGAGYSSLERLISLPADQVKLDICMIQLTETEAGRHLLGGIADFSRDGLMTVVIEGIETEQQRQRLIDVGFTLGQGYLFARPAPVSDAIAALNSRSDGLGDYVVDLTPASTDR